MDKISIIGSGWLGLPLAKAFQESSYEVLASFRNTTTRFELHNEGINSILVDLETNKIPEEILMCDVMCILISPSKNDNYVQAIENLVKKLKDREIRQIVFISSTSVYLDSGEREKSEESPLDENSVITQAEKLFESMPNVCILRLAGLMGENRYLAKYYTDKVAKSDTIVNHIHKEDALGIIEKIVNDNVTGIYNVCTPLHPTRKKVIEEQCRQLGRKEPKFEEGDSKKAIILSGKLDKKIFYMYKYPNPVHFPLIKNQALF